MQIQRTTRTMDGNQAAAHVAYAYGEAAAIYPITPSSPMAELCEQWAAEGRKNIYGRPMRLVQMQSEAGAAGTLHGALLSGALAVTFTASQGLLLMLPNLYRLAGEHLPGVIHVASRSIATHALSIFGDHSDVYACRQTGACIFACGSVQEVMDLSPVPHLAALEGSLPFLNFFDGFRTSHELQKIQVWEYDDLKAMHSPEALAAFRSRCLHPRHGRTFGSAQNPDVFFQAREASNPLYDAMPGIVERQLEKINTRLGTDYGLFNYYGSPRAEHVIIAMGSICETIREYLDYARQEQYGLISVHLYRPFSADHLLAALPSTAVHITVLDRTKEPGTPGDPLYLDVVSALEQAGRLAVSSAEDGSPLPALRVFSGRYGLSSKDTTPGQIAAVYQNTEQKFFTVGITDDVTHLSLPVPKLPDTAPEGTTACKFWGLGGDGTVSATKNAVKIIGEGTSLSTQGYFEYDSKKSRGLTISHLRFGNSPIHSAYRIYHADFVACHNPVYLHKYNMVQELKDKGTFLLNIACRGEELEAYLPEEVKQYLAARHIRFYVIDALGIGKEVGLNNKISTILQAAFFAVTKLLPPERAMEQMNAAAAKSYGREGDSILKMNQEAIRRGFSEVEEIPLPERWLGTAAAAMSSDTASSAPSGTALDNPPLPARKPLADYVKNIQQPVTDQRGDELPVSAFLPYADGGTPSGSTAHERRNVATEIPVWIPENCIQCARCSFVCPHAVIRPAPMDETQSSNAPEGMPRIPMTGLVNYDFSIVISQVDCTGCGSCAAVCPGKQGKKALEMRPAREECLTAEGSSLPAGGSVQKSSSLPADDSIQKGGPAPASGILLHGQQSSGSAPAQNTRAFAQKCFDYAKSLLPCKEAVEKFGVHTLKGSQFRRPLMEFSGACAGCGETPYVKLLTQLFGPEIYIANATGCSSIWANSAPSCAYTLDEKGHGPAWSNSLFEDAAEFGLGMLLAEEVRQAASEAAGNPVADNSATDSTAKDAGADSVTADRSASRSGGSASAPWVIGGDGWAYDIGFGGLDHVLSTGRNINLLVLDTEVYSNTGGQVSKATPLGATAKFISGGKTTRKKNLAATALSYGNVYVAQIAFGADFNQTLKALTEAVAYDGPSLIIAYATCIAHGVKAGLGSSGHEMKKAVDSGYFHLFRFHPSLREQGKNPFILDSGEPSLDYQDFLDGETRYGALKRFRPEEARVLFEEAARQAKARYEELKKLEAFYAPSP
ncbi:MAG: pyruvate:ferredoxin (flavodoxin) oxidoreductase [Butyrivibrio sp.]|nr:pyruvate:ferredoxin (flavodoxin) oxidoreductase [Acetatifactor muris]MCM1561287.1 pyruvate:ferredoxin (flavodoxin) oxidoreductase [Butyrivibrio sp.]